MKKIGQEEKARLGKLLGKTGILLGIGIAYMFFVALTGWGIPCVFHLLTGKYCPGCGISRMFMALARLDIVLAARYNLLVLCLLPFGIVLAICKGRQYVLTGKTAMGTAEKVFYIIAFVLCILFTILRNTHLIPFLRIE